MDQGKTGLGATETPTSTNGGNGIVNRIRDTATAQLNSQKTKATDGIGTVASAVRETTQNLRSQQHDVAAKYVEQAADQLDRFAEKLRNKDVNELLADAQQLARRRPALFVASAFALGLLGARFLKSSAPYSRNVSGRYDRYDAGGAYGSTGQMPRMNTPAASGTATERL